MPSSEAQRVATLWQLAWQNDRLSCAIYRNGPRLELHIESPTAVIVTEQFDFEPRSLARAHAVRDALKRRGWQDGTS